MFVKVVSTPLCGKLASCATYFSYNPFDTTLTVSNEWNFIITNTGYNKFILSQPFYVIRGSLLFLTQTSCQLAIDTSNNIMYSDLVWTNLTYSKLTEFQNWRFYLNTLNNYTYYSSKFYLSHSYANVGIYNITITFSKSAYSFQTTINVTDSESFSEIKITFK